MVVKKCKICGSEKWACFSDDFGRTWTCWGHRKDATEEQRKREDNRRILDEKSRNQESKWDRYEKARKYKSVKRRGTDYKQKTEDPFEWLL